jgi:hypothetical protein
MVTHSLSWASVSDKRVVLYASKLAACAGMHPYVAQRSLADEYASVVLGRADTGWLEPAAQAEQALAQLAPASRAAVDGILAAAPCYAGAAEAAAALEAARAVGGVTDAVMEVVRERLFTAQGNRSEPEVRRQAEAARGTPIVQCAHFRVPSEPWFVAAGSGSGGSSSGSRVFVGGKHDGIDRANARLIEIKTRQRRFLGVPDYERVQVHAYMAIFGLRNATLIESFLGERREHAVPFDDELWERVRGAVEQFLSGLQTPQPADAPA